VAHQRRRIAAEHRGEQARHHRAAHLVLADQGTVDELAAIAARRHHAALLQAREQRGDGGVRKPALPGQRLRHFCRAGLLPRPQLAHHRDLQFAQGYVFLAAHRSRTTGVVLHL